MPVVGVALALVLYPLVLPEPSPGRDLPFIAVSLAFVALLVVVAVKWLGLSMEDVGLGKGTVWKSLLLGTLVGATAPFIAFGLMNIPNITHLPWWRDMGLDVPQLMYRIAFRIPVGTAAFEELAFRGVLFGLLLREGVWKAAWTSTGVFALYHVSLILRMFGADNGEASLLWFVGLVGGGVAVTFIWGLAFAFVRAKSGHIAGCIVTHWLAYSSANVLGFVLARTTQ
jgi:hypothetical protein